MDQITKTGVKNLQLVLCVVTLVAIPLTYAVIYGSAKEGLKALLPGCFASIMAVLLVFLYWRTIGSPSNRLISQVEAETISEPILRLLKEQTAPDVILVERWYKVDWESLLETATSVKFFASFMDTWFASSGDDIRDFFARGGQVTAYLPAPGSVAAQRVAERFPEYTQEMIRVKIEKTVANLQAHLDKAGSRHGGFSVRWTKVFCMECLVLIDNKILVFSPFDHFRGAQIEAPAFVVMLRRFPTVAEWANREFEEFNRHSTPEPQPRKYLQVRS